MSVGPSISDYEITMKIGVGTYAVVKLALNRLTS